MKRPYKEPTHEGVWLHTHHYEGVTYMDDKPLTTAELDRLMQRIEDEQRDRDTNEGDQHP